MPRLRDIKSHKLEKDIKETIQTAVEIDGALFVPAEYDAKSAERTGFSGYSFWGSTFKVFLKNRVAVFLLCLLATIVIFTFVQPLLPGQYPASLIINHPVTGMQMSNVPPALTTVRAKVPAGQELVVKPTYKNDEWSAVTNVIASLPRRTELNAIAFLGDWVQVEYGDTTGYIRNDFTTNLKLPDDPEAVPYTVRSNFQLTIHITPEDLTNNGAELFLETSSLAFTNDDYTRAVTTEPAKLRNLPSENAFWFGTNNIGQDLWSLVWSATRTSLFIGFMVALAEAFIGILIGVLWGYVRQLDRVLTEVYNVLDNIPQTIVLILISYILRPGLPTIIFAMCLTGWVGMARFIRNQIVIIRDRDYNLASRCLGSSTGQIISHNLLPYLVSVIMLRMALAIPGAIGNEVFITYIGLGLPLSIPSLGNLINVGRKLVSTSQSYQLVFPAIVLSIVTISFYIIGNAFADAADPHNHI
jgi:oligopeptide transport system permease protein